MRALVQRVSQARVSVDHQEVATIDAGLVILLGVTHEDGKDQALWLAEKIANLRIFEDEERKFNYSLIDIGGSALVVPQFTLYGDSRKGRRPSFTAAAHPDQAEPLVDFFTGQLGKLGVNVASGVFGARMLVEIHNDGPVTLMLEK